MKDEWPCHTATLGLLRTQFLALHSTTFLLLWLSNMATIPAQTLTVYDTMQQVWLGIYFLWDCFNISVAWQMVLCWGYNEHNYSRFTQWSHEWHAGCESWVSSIHSPGFRQMKARCAGVCCHHSRADPCRGLASRWHRDKGNLRKEMQLWIK